MINPTPVVSLGGVDVAAGPNPDGSWPGLMALDGATVSWGRDEPLAQPTPATAKLSLFDPTGSWAATTAPIGKPITLRWEWAGESRVYFRGRIAAVEVNRPTRHRSPVGRRLSGTVVQLSATSPLVDLANKPAGVPAWFSEDLATRRARIAALAAGALPGGIATRPAWDLVPLQPETEGSGDASVWDVLKSFLANTGGDRWTHDPHTQSLNWTARRTFAAADAARLVRGPGGVTVGGPAVARADAGTAPALSIPAGALEYEDTISREMGAAITRVRINYQGFVHFSAQRKGPGYVGLTVSVLLPGDESVTGPRVLEVDTQIYDTNAAQTAGLDLGNFLSYEGSGWRLEPIRWNTRPTGGFPTIEHARLMLAGTETHGVFWLAGSWFPTAGVLPLFGVMGGQIAYTGGAWVVDINPAPTSRTTAPAGVGWEALSPALTWDDLDDSLTYEDMAFVTSGAVQET